jgi:peptidoglycan hydrolase-like protein with peptidoglycan-binding domain
MRHFFAASVTAMLAVGPLAASEEPRIVRQAQERLMSEGFDPGPVDGVLSWETRQALKDFQELKRLQPTGRLDAPTIGALGIGR